MKIARSDQDRPTSVYVVECGGRVKIGKAVNVASRLRTMSTNAPHEVRLLHSREFPNAEAAYHVETRMHRFFHRDRAKGEWFDMEPALAVDFLKSVKPLGPRRRTRSHRSDLRQTPEDIDMLRDALNRVHSRQP